MKKELLGKGIFVRNDINGQKCCVGDNVKIIRPAMRFWINEDDEIVIEETIWEGQIILRLSQGIVIKVGKKYIHPKITNRSRNKWLWELLK